MCRFNGFDPPAWICLWFRTEDSAGDLCSQRDNALGRCDARVIHRPREEELTESQKAEREALQKEADDLIKQHREMRLKTSAP
eukprot:symbB.v1.2.013721.t1/scaffold977.1/size148281/4